LCSERRHIGAPLAKAKAKITTMKAEAHLPLFPIPKSGTVQVLHTPGNTFNVVCRGADKSDQKMLIGFFGRMRGILHTFRFDYGGVNHEPCRFASSTCPSPPVDPLILAIVKLKP
jgi:hypothetical protein